MKTLSDKELKKRIRAVVAFDELKDGFVKLAKDQPETIKKRQKARKKRPEPEEDHWMSGVIS